MEEELYPPFSRAGQQLDDAQSRRPVSPHQHLSVPLFPNEVASSSDGGPIYGESDPKKDADEDVEVKESVGQEP